MKIFLLIVFALLVSSQAFADNSISIMTEEFAPYQFYEGEGDKKTITGISIEIVQAIQKKVNNSAEIKVLPWSRALKLLAKKKNSALFSTARTPAREDRYKWVGPISKLEIVFFKKTDSQVKFDSLEDAKKLAKIGVTKNVATHEILTNMGFTNLDIMQSGSDEKNLKRLIKNRIDVWPTAYYAGIYSAKRMGILDKIEVIPGVSIMSGFLYIAFNIETDNQIIHQWQLALDQLKSEGVVEKIIKKYDR
jgi:polar amino acid transport system substrate-binding protein